MTFSVLDRVDPSGHDRSSPVIAISAIVRSILCPLRRTRLSKSFSEEEPGKSLDGTRNRWIFHESMRIEEVSPCLSALADEENTRVDYSREV